MGRRGRPPFPDILTPREWEVLALLRENLTNEAIAARLGVTHAAAKYHVSEILSKLGVASREEAAAWEPEAEAAREPQLRRWGLGLVGLLRPVTLGKAALVGASLVVLAGLGVLAWGVLRTSGDGLDGEATPLPSAGAIPELPDGFIRFGEDLESAIQDGTVDFVAMNTVYSPFDCGGSLPAGGPNCVEASPGTGQLGIGIGSWNSEGDVYDEQSYSSFLRNWGIDTDATRADRFGDSVVRLAAIGEMPGYLSGSTAATDMVLIATKIGKLTPPADVTSPLLQRQALVFFVKKEGDGFKIYHLMRATWHFVDPYHPESVQFGVDKLFMWWLRWEDGVTLPTRTLPDTAATLSPTPYLSTEQAAIDLVMEQLANHGSRPKPELFDISVEQMLYGEAAERAQPLGFGLRILPDNYYCPPGASCPHMGEPADQRGWLIIVGGLDGYAPEPGLSRLIAWVGEDGGISSGWLP